MNLLGQWLNINLKAYDRIIQIFKVIKIKTGKRGNASRSNVHHFYDENFL